MDITHLHHQIAEISKSLVGSFSLGVAAAAFTSSVQSYTGSLN